MFRAIATSAILLLSVASAQAADCTHPPYGGNRAAWREFVTHMPAAVPSAKLWAGLCRSKFKDGDRTALHDLGVNDTFIDQHSVDELAGLAMEDIVRQMKAEKSSGAGR